MSHLVENERLSDVVFLVGPEEKRFAAHQVILAARSETFARLFKGTRDSGSARNGRLLSYDEEKLKDAEKQDDDEENKSYKKEKGKDKDEGQIRIEIKVPELSPEVFQCLLRYLYTSAVDIKLESACELFKAADMYHLSDLKRSSEEFLKQNTTIENVTSLLLSAQKFQVQSVRSYCLDYLLWHFDPVSKDPSFARDLLPNTELIREILLCRKKFKSSGGSGRVGSGSNLTTAITLPGYGYTYGVTSNSNPNLNAGPGLGIGVSVGGGVALGMQNAMASPGSSPQLQSSTPQTNMSVCFPNSLIKDLKSLLVREPENVFADVLFVVGQEVSDTPQIFHAHKVILCTRCEIFDAMFRTPTFKESTTSTIHIPNIRPTVFSCLLSYLYLGTCPLHYDNAFELYTAADQYMLSDLKLVCEDFLMTEVSIDNVADVLLDADETGVESVRKGAIELVVREFDDVSVTSRFLKEVVLRQDLMLEILQSRGT
ncbi:BTB/POZ protein [Paraphysoderma sedebokerense]|nr:BTB/POZ protein [Paraphysoderma sedebokerense]